MSRLPRQSRTPAFKAKTTLAGLKSDRTLAQLSEHFEVYPNQISARKVRLEDGTSNVFGARTMASTTLAVDVESLHAKTGELTLDQTQLLGLLGYNLRRASVIFMNDFSAMLGETGLSPTEFSVLMLLEGRTNVTQATLCRTLGVKAANMTPMVGKLEAHGLIKKVTDHSDRRSPKVRLTPKAKAAMPGWRDMLRKDEARLQGTLTETEKRELIRLLQKIWLVTRF
jgi:DNA-binding MarR family transcriptional regulator